MITGVPCITWQHICTPWPTLITSVGTIQAISHYEALWFIMTTSLLQIRGWCTWSWMTHASLCTGTAGPTATYGNWKSDYSIFIHTLLWGVMKSTNLHIQKKILEDKAISYENKQIAASTMPPLSTTNQRWATHDVTNLELPRVKCEWIYYSIHMTFLTGNEPRNQLLNLWHSSFIS